MQLLRSKRIKVKMIIVIVSKSKQAAIIFTLNVPIADCDLLTQQQYVDVTISLTLFYLLTYFHYVM